VSQVDVANRHPQRRPFELRGLWCRPHRIDEGLPTPIARESAKAVCCHDHNFFAAMDGHQLRVGRDFGGRPLRSDLSCRRP
jgi:hypothetical protein